MAKSKKQDWEIIDTPYGQWEYPGSVTRIPSNEITMQGVPYPVLGISNTGDMQYMEPGGEYSYDGSSVTEYPLPEAGGGYRVIRSNERKGKTHKVIGPGGKVKFFGDSKLGQHPKDPARKKAFYARHKKNLAKNPYFRAFARKTWADGGELNDWEILDTAQDGELITERKDFKPWWNWASRKAGDVDSRQDAFGTLGDLYAYYAGQPLHYNTLEYSKYKPTNSKDPNATYISINDPKFKQEIFDKYNDVFVKKQLQAGLSTLTVKEDKINDNTYAVSGYSKPTPEQLKEYSLTKKPLYAIKGKGHVSNAIGRYFLSKGKDDKGEYISYYDTFDEGSGPNGGGIGETLKLTKPFEIYGRIYLDPKTGKPVQPEKPINPYIQKAPLPGQSVQTMEYAQGGMLPDLAAMAFGGNLILEKYQGGGSKRKKKKQTIAETPTVDMYGRPIESRVITKPDLERSYYDPRRDAIFMQKDYNQLDPYDKEKMLAHENYHAYQFKNDRSTYLPVRDIPYQRPPMVATDEYYYGYHNRKPIESQIDIDRFKEKNPSFRFVSDDAIFNYIVDPEQYLNPETLEGEAKFYEDLGVEVDNPAFAKKFGGLTEMGNGGHGGLDRWFAEKWVDVKTGKPCGRQKGEKRKGYPACRPSKRVSSETPKTSSELSPSEKAKFKREKTSSKKISYQHRKKEEGGNVNDREMVEGIADILSQVDNMSNRKQIARNMLSDFKNEGVSYDYSNFLKDSGIPELKSGGNVATNSALWSKAKSMARSKFDVYPSAYANAWAAKWYKSKGGGWRKKAEGGSVWEILPDSNEWEII